MHNSTAWGYSNCGLVASDGQALLVDTQFTLAGTRLLLNAVEAAVPRAEITTVVNSHQNGDHTWGNQLLPDAEIITSAASAEHVCKEISPEQMMLLGRAAPTSAVTAYAAEHIGGFDFSGITVTGATRTFTGTLDLEVGGVAVELIDLGPAHSEGDVAVHVPGDQVVFTGDTLFIGAHMIVWSDSLSACIAACDRLLSTGATTFVPGHGEISGRAGVVTFRDGLARVHEDATSYALSGVELPDAARLIKGAHAGGLAHPERLFTAVAAAYKEAGVEGGPSTTMGLVEGMAQLARE
ncbi:MBL fold metallo-hydrolase [Streptomyces albofaciens]|uniref:MBL fold metallo-hydrolase n=1 Tax=Streptomyces albofaciens TaxID=66866 RepID=UPI00123AAF86|nr:MBL fold metallo-hydrolase [Streptomyces albofaciens]